MAARAAAFAAVYPLSAYGSVYEGDISAREDCLNFSALIPVCSLGEKLFRIQLIFYGYKRKIFKAGFTSGSSDILFLTMGGQNELISSLHIL